MKKIFEKLLVFLIGLAVVLFLAEFALRLIGVLDENQRSNKNLSRLKNSDKHQIMTIGNSYTAGVGAPAGESYSDFLETLLNEKSTKPYEVINRGIVNANSSFLREQLDEWLNIDSPKYALLMVGEPNYWNTYNYTAFLNKDKNKTFLGKASELIQRLKVYRLFELLEYQLVGEQVDYEVFKSIPRNKKNQKILGYNYLAALDYSVVLNVKQINEKMRDEAILSIEKVYEEDRSATVSRILAALYFQKKEFEKGLDVLALAVKKIELFDYNVYLLLKETSFPENLNEKVQSLIETLKHKKMLITLEEMIAIDKEKDFYIDRTDVKKAKKLYRFYKHSPNVGNLAGFLSRYFVNVSGKYFYEIIKITLENNPLSMAYDSHAHISILRDQYPKFNDDLTKLLANIEKRVGQNPFESSQKIDKKTRDDWVLYDLELMIKTLRAHGIIVVVQTYPPMRSKMVRPVDNVIRRWWKTRDKEEGVYFQDLNMILKRKFDDRTPEGLRYYSTEWGHKDPHQSSLGNMELAREMASFVLEIQAAQN